MVGHYSRGQSLLALVFFVGIIVVAGGVTLVFLANSSVNNIYGYRASVRAEAVAASGVEDALLQLDRDASFSDTTGYDVAVGSSTATVTVTQDSPSSGFATILSVATVSQSTKKISVVAAVNATTSAVSVISWTDVQ